ncbi:MAG TPA: hypothetical protein VLA88_06355 [Candidatus Saccharimonadales bacterium]|nr:hypothetical protein [Candidatus Saccharimonadales bacterium]
MRLSEIMSEHGITEWWDDWTSRKGNQVLIARSVEFIDPSGSCPHGKATLTLKIAVVKAGTDEVLHFEIEVRRWTY